MKDKMTVLNVIGGILKKPELLLEEDYRLDTTDFPERFHKIVYASIRNLVETGMRKITSIDVDNFLSQYDKQYKIFQDNEGIDFLENAKKIANVRNFDYYYIRLKKISLLNTFKDEGMDIREIYDNDIIDISLQEKMQAEFDKMSIDDIINHYEGKFIKIREDFKSNHDIVNIQAGKGMKELIDEYKEVPEMGMPSGSKIYNTITRGMRRKKFYLRSTPSGIGKTRMAVEDICAVAIGKYYDNISKKWIDTGISEPSLFIATEQEKDEIQTLILSNVSGVNEEIILDGKYEGDQEERVLRATEIIADAPIWIEEQPTFSIDDIENSVKRNKIEHNIQFVFFDYIFMSVKMLTDLSSKTRGMNLREDNVLYMFANKMKELANKLNIHINSSSQLNGTWENARDANMNMLRGAKSLADLCYC